MLDNLRNNNIKKYYKNNNNFIRIKYFRWIKRKVITFKWINKVIQVRKLKT